MIRKNQMRAVAEVQAALHVHASFRKRLDLRDEGRGIDHHAGANDRLLLGAQNPAGDELQHEAILADDDGVAGIVSTGDARDEVESASEIVDDLAFAFVTPLRADHYD